MWLLKTETFNKMHAMIKAGTQPTQEQIEAHSEKYQAIEQGAKPIIASAANGVGSINIEGVLTKKPDFFAFLFGGGNATYQDIISSIDYLNADASVNEIVLNIDSPGGNVDGMFEAIYAIRDSKKPVKAVVSGLGASAAYGLASQANTIEATNEGVFIGSVGTAATFYNDDNVVTVTSTNAPNKRPNVTTEAGLEVIQGELDAIADLFVEAIAEGRGTTEDNVNKNFGRGGTFLAGEALKRGMIDSILQNKQINVIENSSNNINPFKAKIMDLKTLQLEHAELYDQVREDAVAEERIRVEAHLIMGESSGDMKTALQAVKDGSLMNAKLQATYMSAGLKKNDIEARQADEDDVKDLNNLSNEGNPQDENSDWKQVVDLVAQGFGVN